MPRVKFLIGGGATYALVALYGMAKATTGYCDGRSPTDTVAPWRWRACECAACSPASMLRAATGKPKRGAHRSIRVRGDAHVYRPIRPDHASA